MIESYAPILDSTQHDLNQKPNRAQVTVDTLPSSSVTVGRSSPTQGQSHHRQHPVRRRKGDGTQVTSWRRTPSALRCNLYIVIAIVISCCCSLSIAAATPVIPERIPNPLDNAPADLRSTLADLAKTGTILVDQRPPPVEHFWELDIETTIREGLWRRQNSDPFSQSSSTSKVASPSATSTPSQSSSASKVASSSVSSGTPASSGTSSNASPLPSPFDSSLGANFTSQACPDFISSFLSNATFKSCLPFSLLLESSNSFFQAEKSLIRITQTLDYTCSANVTTCNTLMSALAANLTSANTCGPDYTAQNPTVLQAYTGLLAYKPLYQASCLKNPSTSSYCFADAVTNSSSPEDSYVYYLALNSSLPGGSQPTCNTCLQNTMAVFSAAAANRSQPVASTYVAAAQMINVNCGPGFVNASIPAPVASSAYSTVTPYPMTGLLALVGCVIAWLL